MPVGNVTIDGQEWRQIYADDFAGQAVPLGKRCGDRNAFAHKLSNWSA
jgi:hypothetical protein